MAKKEPNNKNSKREQTLFAEMARIFLPRLAMKDFGISKKDFRKVQDSTSMHMSFISFVGAFASLVCGILFLIFCFTGVWLPETVNRYVFIGCYSLIIGSALSIVLLGISLFSIKTTKGLRVTGDILFHLAIAVAIIEFVHADLINGSLSSTDAISAAVILLIPLILCQPGYWGESVAINGTLAILLGALFIYGYYQYGMRSLESYLMTDVGFLFACYCAYSAYTYVELQRFYIEFRNAELLSRSTHDTLTGARNRNGLRLYLEDHLNIWPDRKETVLAVMLDIDDFKLYNDSYGHLQGDDVLVEISEALSNLKDFPHAHLFRYGGEEFLVILSHVNEDRAKEAIEAMRKAVEDLKYPAPKGAPCEYITISLGGALWKVGDDYSFHSHVEDADEALYEAKSSGKNCWKIRVKIDDEGAS
ncbi:MAG: GGDEF domain-containing protein [Bacilli bacterium]|nr:GGDEF domain-containing protein [Bacilli bacterium]